MKFIWEICCRFSCHIFTAYTC